MKAIGYKNPGSAKVLQDLEIPTPVATGYDILVEVKAVAVNPVDCKVRTKSAPGDEGYRILGWDAAGIVRGVGENVTLFEPGDEVWYAGDLTRMGCNSEFHLVNEDLVGKKPGSLSFTQAAALPLTSLTAWELLFDRLNIDEMEEGTLLITGAAGGVGSVLVQMARQLTSLKIVGTASRQDSMDWVIKQGAHNVIDHNHNLHDQLQNLEIGPVDYVISLTHTDTHAQDLVNCLKPQGKFALIDDPQNLDIKIFKLKSISIHWEMMFTRSMFQTEDKINQYFILNKVAYLVDQGIIKTTLNEEYGSINAANMRKAHELIESGRMRGKIVMSGF